jgi:hypothetical protein
MLAAAEDVARASGGAFDVTVGRYTRLWRRARRQGEPPRASELAAVRTPWATAARVQPRAGRRAVRAPGRARHAPRPGGIAKGYALDAALAVLPRHGLERALVVGGGDVPPARRRPARGLDVLVAGLDSADPRSGPRRDARRARARALSTPATSCAPRVRGPALLAHPRPAHRARR